MQGAAIKALVVGVARRHRGDRGVGAHRLFRGGALKEGTGYGRAPVIFTEGSFGGQAERKTKCPATIPIPRARKCNSK